jgi:hypothetical protein
VPNAVTATPPRDLLTWRDNNGVHWAAIGTDTHLFAYRFDTQVLYDITPTGVGSLDPPGPPVGYGLGNYGAEAYGTARDAADIGPQEVAANQGDRWSLASWGQDLLIVPTQDGHLFHWSPTTPATLPAIIAAAPTLNKGVIVTDQRSAVLLGAGGDPRNIAWSDQENYNIWAPDVTNLAGSKRLASQSYALTAAKVSQGILIWTAADLHLMTYVGPPYAYGITQIAAGCGPASARAVVAIGSTVIWPGHQSFWAWAGSVTPFQSDVGDWMFSVLNRGYIGRLFGSPNPAFSEMWWDWPDEGAQECTRYVAVNFADPAHPWTIGVRNRTAADPIGALDYPVLGGPLGNGGGLYLHEYGWLENGAPRAPNGLVYAQSGAITLGEGDVRFAVTQLVFDAACGVDDMLGYRFTVRENPYDEASEYDTGLFTVVHNGLMDMRFSGRTAAMRMEALFDADFAVGRPRLIIQPAGRR